MMRVWNKSCKVLFRSDKRDREGTNLSSSSFPFPSRDCAKMFTSLPVRSRLEQRGQKHFGGGPPLPPPRTAIRGREGRKIVTPEEGSISGRKSERKMKDSPI